MKRSRSTTSASLLLLLAGCAAGQAGQTRAPASTPTALASPGPTPEPSSRPATTACRLLASPAERAQGLTEARLLHARAPSDRAGALALARCTHLAADTEKDDARVLGLTEEGMAAIAQASLATDDAEAAYLHALNLGLYVRARGMLAVGRLSELLARLQVAGAQPAQDQGGPLRVLGLLYVRAPSWPVGPGDLDAALELLKRAVRDYPDHPLNHLYLAYALLDAGERAQARAEALRARELCQTERFGEWAALWRTETEELLARAR